MTILDVDIAVRRGAFDLAVTASVTAPTVGLFGRSGSGKSSLLHVLAGLLRADRGRVVVRGTVLDDSTDGTRVRPHRRRVGLVFQDDRLFPHLSVRGNLRYGMRDRSAAVLERDVVDLLELDRFLGRRPRDLSGGERRRVALGRALLASPELLLLDEPLTGLDAEMKASVLPYLLRMRAELDLPMVYVSHDLREVLRLTDELLLLEQGRVAGHGRYADLVHSSGVMPVLHGLGLTNLLELEPSDDADLPWRLAGTEALVRLPHAAAARSPQPTMATVRPEDIAIARGPVEGTSIQNQLRGRVRRVARVGERVIVEVDVGQTLQVEITPRALEALGITADLEVWCLVKSTAIDLGP